MYDESDRIKSQSVLGETGELFKTEYNYDRTGNLKSRNDSINGKDEYYYDPVGRIKKNIDSMKRVKEFVHDKAGNYLKTEIKEEENSWKRVGTYDKISYEYDKAGNLIQRADTTFKWDSNNRLVESSINGKDEYYYDPVGRIKKNIDPLKRVKEFVHDKAGNYLKTEIKEEENSWKRVGTYDKISYEYDKAGNLIQRADTTFKWDSNNRLVTSQNNNIKTEYKYDPLGRRISKETDGKITNFYWEGNKLISATERDYHYYPYSFECCICSLY